MQFRTPPTGKPTGAQFLQLLSTFATFVQNCTFRNNLCNMSQLFVTTLCSNVDTLQTCHTTSHNFCNTPDKHLQHPDTSRHIPTHLCNMLTHICNILTKFAHMFANVAHIPQTCPQRLCKALQRLCKASEIPETPKSALQSLCRPKSAISGGLAENPYFPSFPGLGPFGPHLPLYKRLKV